MNESYFVVLILLLISVLTGVDLVRDLSEGVSLSHALLETMIITLCSLGIFIFIWKIRKDKRDLSVSLGQTREDLNYWKKRSASFIEGLSLEIENQFSEWKLSKSEKDIALMLIKGFATKEIAAYRKTAEKTIRVQTSSIYKKAQVANRNELAAFFLEDLLIPTDR